MDILRVLSTPDLEVRKKTLQLALDLVSSRNVEEVSGQPARFSPLPACSCCQSLTSVCVAVGDRFEERSDQDEQRERTRRHR